MNLFLDLGNSRFKWASSDADALHSGPALAWNVADFDAALGESWRDLPAPQRILAANVASGDHQQLVERTLLARFGQAPQWLRSPAARAGVRNAYSNPETLGIDRFLALLAAFADGRAPCVVAGCGSALTLDALSGDGQHLGGLIAPGIRAMQHGLQAAAPGLPPATEVAVVDLARDSGNAVSSGSWQAAAGAIERFYRHMTARLGGAPQLLLSGGDAPTLLRLLGPPAQSFDDAVLRGLQVWAQD